MSCHIIFKIIVSVYHICVAFDTCIVFVHHRYVHLNQMYKHLYKND